jgi:hypothetical protein
MTHNRFEEALLVQNACNACGVAGSLFEICKQVLHETHSTDAVRRDPAVRLFVAKLADMCGLEYTWPVDADLACEANKSLNAPTA